MKPTLKLLAVILLTATVFISYSPRAYVQPRQNYLQINNPNMPGNTPTETKQSGFFKTFCKTPFAIVTALTTLAFLIFSMVLEFGANLVTGFSYKYPVSNDIKAIGWDQVTADWWWNPGVSWHLGLSIIIWLLIAKRQRKD